MRRAALLSLSLSGLLAAAYIGVFVLDPSGDTAGSRPWQLAYAAMEALAALTVLLVGRSPGVDARSRRAWTWLAAALFLLSLSAGGVSGVSGPSALVADWGWLLCYPCFCIGLLSFPREPLDRRDRLRVGLDGAILLVSAGLLLWYLGTSGVRLDGPGRFATFAKFNILILLGDALVLYVMLVAAVRSLERAHRASWALLLSTFALSTTGDVLFVSAPTDATSATAPIAAPYVLWTLSAWFLALAAVLETRAPVRDVLQRGVPRVRRGVASAAPYAATTVLAIVTLLEGARLQNVVFRLLAVGMVLVAVLVTLRLVLALRENAALLAEQVRQVEQLRESQKLEAVGRLAGGVAHEFNNLLLVIQQGSEAILARGPQDEDARDVRAAAGRAAELTRQLLTFSRRESSSGTSNPAQALAEVRPLLQRLLRPDLTLDVVVLPGVSAVGLDRSGVDQVLFNLVRNAVDAIESSGRIGIRLQPSPRPGFVRLQVSDTGSGMPEAVRERLFEPFFSTKPVGRGTGLGLAIVHGLVTGAGGSIDVETALGTGTTFTVDLPVSVPAAGEAHPSAPVVPPVTRAALPGVLLVDDEPAVRRSLRRTLERLGHPVQEAEDGAIAIALLEEGAEVALVLTDTVMPNVDGWALIRHLRQRRPTLPIIRMSGFAEVPDEHRDVRADAFLAKPFDLATLRQTVRDVMSARAGDG